jgi:hypothetical protein
MRIHQAIRSSHRSDGQKTWAIRAVSAIMGLLFALNTYVLFRPIPWVDPPLFAQIGLFYAAAVWNFGALFSGPLLLVARASGLLGRAIVRLWRGRASGVSADPANPGRRRFLQAGVGGIAAAPVLLSGYGAAYAAKTYDVQELTLPFGLPLRVVQLTDIHAGLYMTRDEIRRYADQAMALQPELFVLTGDYISNSMAFLRGCLEELARVQAPFGTIATLGNHEHLCGGLPTWGRRSQDWILPFRRCSCRTGRRSFPRRRPGEFP